MRMLKCLGTGSSGNCWILNSDSKRLIIDAGIHVKKIKAGLNWNLGGVCGGIVSHEHQDHARAEQDLLNMGLCIWTPYRFTKKVATLGIGPFNIVAFDVPHNGVENRGFVVSEGDWKMCYITDFEYVPYNLREKHLHTMLVECNYSDIDDDADNLEHVVFGHASLSTTTRFVEHNATEDLQYVILCHLSKVNADPDLIAEKISSVVPPGCQVIIAEAGQEYQI